MKRLSTFIVITLLATGVAFAPALAGESHTATADDIHQALDTTPTPVDQQRDEVQAFLDRPEVRDVASSHGVDTATLAEAVATMSADELAPVLAQVDQFDSEMAGGDRIVLTSSAVIIILLIIILIIVA